MDGNVPLKTALVFDDLIQFGGAEKLLLAVHEIWPDAPVFTSVVSEEWLQKCKRLDIKVQTSFMQKLPFKKILNRFYSVLGLHMLAFESFNFSDYDLVFSISSRYAHGVLTKPSTLHVCYMNSPGRMFWDTFSYFSKESFFTRVFRFLISPFLTHVRNWDYTAAQRVDYFIANSPVPQSRIRRFYNRDSEVIFPFVEFPSFDISELQNTHEKESYYLVLTRLSSWKRVDLAIKACQKLNLNLKIIGEGSARKSLEKLADPETTEFLGFVTEQEKWKLLANCKALIMTQKEDFGITPLEAMIVGKPVIAYKEGGAQVTVLSGETGEFFEKQTVDSLVSILRNFTPTNYSPKICQEQARRFQKEKFKFKIMEFINKVY